MYKLTLGILVFFLATSLRSQRVLGLYAGPTLATIAGDAVQDGVTISNKLGIRLGYQLEPSIGNELYVQFGTAFTGRGYKAEKPDAANEVSIVYVEIPVLLVKKISVGSEGSVKIIVGAGPFGALGFHYQSKLTLTDAFGTNTIFNSGDLPDFGVRRGDFGFLGQGGVEFGRFQVLLNYQLGLTTIFYSDDFGNVKNRVMGFSLVYLTGH